MPVKVTILGAASAKPTADRHPSAQIVNVNEQYYLVDAGEGVQQQMFRRGFNPLKLRGVFISHLHGDHVYGLFPLISTLGLYGRQTPLEVFAPQPFGEILDCHLRYFDSHLPYEVKWTEVPTTEHRLIFENRTLEVWSIPLRHSLAASGYLFREKPPQLNVDKFKIERYGLSIAQIVAAKRGEAITLDDGTRIENSDLTYLPYLPASYAYCSDTIYMPELEKQLKGIDLLYHEATFCNEDVKRAKETYHTTSGEAAALALKADVKKLLIGHFSARYTDSNQLLRECRSIFRNTVAATEGLTVDI